MAEEEEGRRKGGKDKRKQEDGEHGVKVLLWHSAQCEVSTSLSDDGGGRGR